MISPPSCYNILWWLVYWSKGETTYMRSQQSYPNSCFIMPTLIKNCVEKKNVQWKRCLPAMSSVETFCRHCSFASSSICTCSSAVISPSSPACSKKGLILFLHYVLNFLKPSDSFVWGCHLQMSFAFSVTLNFDGPL